MSYHEYRTDGFLRLNDYEWEETYLIKSLRLEWVRSYIADKYGHQNETILKLLSLLRLAENPKSGFFGVDPNLGHFIQTTKHTK